MVLRECNNDLNVSRQNAKQKPSRARNHHTIQDRVDKNDPYDLDIAACIREFERCGRADCVVNNPSSTQQSKAVSVPSTNTMHANRNERQSLIVRHPIPNPSSVPLDALRNNIGDTCNHKSIPKTPLLNPQTTTMKRPWVRTPPGFPSKSHLRRDDSQTTPYLSVQPLQQRESFSVGQRLVLRQQYETVAGTRFDTQCPSVQQDPNAKNRAPSLVLRNATNENKPAILSSTHHCALARKTAQGTQPRDKKHEILLLTRQGDPISLDQAESFLRKLVHRHSRETVAVLPDLESFTVYVFFLTATRSTKYRVTHLFVCLKVSFTPGSNSDTLQWPANWCIYYSRPLRRAITRLWHQVQLGSINFSRPIETPDSIRSFWRTYSFVCSSSVMGTEPW